MSKQCRRCDPTGDQPPRSWRLHHCLACPAGGFRASGADHRSRAGVAETATAIGVGWAAGAGVEWGFAPNWSARAEYLHLDLGSKSFTFPMAQQRNDAKVTLDIARVGVNYKFGQ